jgi:hypothetical protein
MFRPSTNFRELVKSLAKVTLLLKHSVNLRHCILCGDVAECLEMECAKSTNAISRHADTYPQNTQ